LDINREKLLRCAEDGQAMQILSEYLEGIYNDEAVALSTEPRTAQKVLLLLLQAQLYRLYKRQYLKECNLYVL
jgi:TBC1 domain family member 8/9